jgi:tellurite methyltransferase
MGPNHSVGFFDSQFRQQVRNQDFQLNPFELLVLPYLKGRVLDFGCGLGNLAVAAAQQGCSVVALDASPAAIDHLRQRALREALPVEAVETDLRDHEIAGDFDCVVSIGLLMCFDRASALHQLSGLQKSLRPGGLAMVNTLVEGTTYLDIFGSGDHYLFARDEMAEHFAGWDILHAEFRDFDAPNGRIKSFVTLIARKPPRQGTGSGEPAVQEPAAGRARVAEDP